MKLKNVMYRCVLGTAVVMAVSLSASASAITFAGSSGSASASAVFSLTGSTLTVTLSNTSSADVLVPTDVLTAVFFDSTHTLTPVSASLNGSTVHYGSLTNVGDGWGYGTGLNAHGENSAISATGSVTGLGHSNFSGANNALDGLGYGLLSAGDNTSTGNTGVTGHGPLILNSAQFTLTAPTGFSLSELGNTVVFQYGTALSDQNYVGILQNQPVPESGTLGLVGSGLLSLAFGLRKRLFNH